MTPTQCFDAWKIAMSSPIERDFFNYALEMSIIRNIPYNGRLGNFNPTTQTITLKTGSVIYVTPAYRAKLIVHINNILNNFEND